jgi:hypothetical protein
MPLLGHRARPRALTADSSTPAGSAIVANAADGYYRHGDVAASPAARTRVIVNAVDRDGVSIMLTMLPDGRVTDMITALGMPADVTVNAGGAVNDGLSSVLTAMYGVYHDLLPLADPRWIQDELPRRHSIEGSSRHAACGALLPVVRCW